MAGGSALQDILGAIDDQVGAPSGRGSGTWELPPGIDPSTANYEVKYNGARPPGTKAPTAAPKEEGADDGTPLGDILGAIDDQFGGKKLSKPEAEAAISNAAAPQAPAIPRTLSPSLADTIEAEGPREPVPVPGSFGQPVASIPVQREINKENYDAAVAAQKDLEEREQHPTRLAFQGPGTFAGTQIEGDTWSNLFSDPVGYAKSVLTKKNLKTLATAPPIQGAYAVPPSFVQKYPKLGAFSQGALGAASGFLTPENIGLIGGLEGVGGLTGALATRSKALYGLADAAADAGDWNKAFDAFGAARKISMANNALRAVNTTMSAGFTAQFANSLYKESKEFKAAVDEQDWSRAAEVAGEAVPDAIFTASGIRDAMRAAGRVRTGIQERAAAKAQAMEMAAANARNVTPTPPEQLPAINETKAPEPETITPKTETPAPQNETKAPIPETVGAGEQLAPEAPATLKAQTDALAKGTNKVVYFPKGTASLPEPPENSNVTVVKGSKPGAGTYYHDASVTPAQIRAAVKDGTYGQLLGHEQTKEEATAPGATPAAVVARDNNGNEQKASIVDLSKPEVAQAQAETLAKQFPQATVSAEPAEQVIAARQAPEIPTTTAPKEEAKPAAPVALTPERRAEISRMAAASAAVPRTPSAETAGRKFGSTQFNLEKADAGKVLGIHVNPEDFAEKGRETNPHVTALFGLHDQPISAIKKVAKKTGGPIEATLGKLEAFPPGKDGQPLVIRVNSPALHDLHNRLAELPHTDTHPEYKPHITIGYLKPGRAEKYLKEGNPLEGEKVTLSNLIHSAKDETETPLDLGQGKNKPVDHILNAIEEQVKPTLTNEPEKSKENLTPERTIEPEKESANVQRLEGEGEKPLEEVPTENVPPARAEREAGGLAEQRSGENAERVHPERAERNGPLGGAERGREEQPVAAERGRSAAPRRATSSQSGSSQSGNDYRITEADHIGEGTEREKFAANAEAISVLKGLEAAGRPATPEEQSKLVKYTGWGWSGNKLNEYHDQWRNERKQLQSLLTEEEYDAAVASTKNAHYTSPQIITPTWDAVRRLGFTGGRILEPSAGVGHFLGLMPNDLFVNSRKTAIELDKISGRILKQLYQNADVRIQGFEELKGLDNFYDLAISNVPFGDYHVHDAAYNKYKLNIHNYFIAKMLDKVRPGGLVVAITSHHTMDSSNPKARQLFAQRGDLIDAIRLPGGAFEKNAGTDVTTDLLFFKRRAPEEKAAGHAFQGITGVGEDRIPVNEYFEKNPEMALGTHSLQGKMYGYGAQYKLLAGAEPIEKSLPAAIAKFPENVMTTPELPKSVTEKAAIESLPAWGDTKPFGYAVKDGKVFQNLDGAMVHQAEFTKGNVASLEKMLGIRNSVRELFGMEARGLAGRELTDARGRLNRLYDAFSKKHGYLNNTANQRIIGDDPDGPLLSALEKWDKKTKTASKADVFFKPTITPRKEVSSVERPEDALPASLAEKGRIDFDYMSKVSGATIEQLQNSLRESGTAFRTPQGHWEAKDEYLSGNVRQKLRDAEEASKLEPDFQKNVEALKAVQPRDLEAGEISVRLGTPWIPEDDVAKFIDQHILEGGRFGRQTTVRHVTSEAIWKIDNRFAKYDEAAKAKWGTARVDPLSLIDDALNLRRPTVYDKGEGDKSVVNEKETLAAREKLEQIDQAFSDWLFKDPERAQRLVAHYNENYNNLVDREWDGSHLTFPGKSTEIQLRPNQTKGVWRSLVGGNTLLAHTVGAGKTYTIVASAMEAKRLGLAKKPMVVVPNHLVEQWASDFLRLYPQARVLAATKEEWGTGNRKQLMSKIATGEWDAVIVPHSSFTLLPVADATFQKYAQRQLDMIEEHIRTAAKEEGKRSRTVKQLEKAKSRIEARLKKALAKERKDNTINFEDTGVDRLYVDEAHLYKNLYFPSKMGNINGIPKSDSQRAFDMYMKSKYISDLNNGNGVVFATGTPISNTMAEIYTMQRYMDEGALEQSGLQHFDSWAAMFGQTVQNMEVSPEDPTRFRISTRFSKFKNVGELKRMFRQRADVILPQDLQGIVKVPEIMSGKPTVVEVPATRRVLDYIGQLGKRATAIRKREVDPTEDNMLKITSEGRKVALDYRSMFPGEPDDGQSKITEAAKKIADIYRETRDSKRTQAIMLDLMTPSDAGKKRGQLNAYADLKNKLVGMGVPADQIAFIHSAKTDAAKQELFDKVNAGDVAVILGSSDKMGVGTNIQQRLIAEHHIDAPWRPSDIEQREGRILRQGNSNPVVQIYRYVTQGTFDAYMWSTISRKAQFIHDMMQHGYDVRELEDSDGASLSYAEAAAIATGDKRVLEKVKTDTDVDRLQKLKSIHESQRVNNQVKLAQIPDRIGGLERAISDIEEDIQTRKKTVPEKFALSSGKQTYTERKEAGAVLNAAAEKNRGSDARRVGEYGGFDIIADGSGNLHLSGTASHWFKLNHENPLGTIQSMELALNNLESQVRDRHEVIGELNKSKAAFEEELKKPFPKQGELEKALAKQAELNEALAVDKEDPTMAGAKEDAEFNEDFKEVAPSKPSEEIEESESGVPRRPHRPGEAGFIEAGFFLDLAHALGKLVARAFNALRGPEEEPETPTPPRTETRSEAPRTGPPRTPGRPVERAGNIRLDKLNAPEDVLNEVRRVAQEHGPELEEQRRGTIPHDKTRDAARALINEGMFTENDLKNMQKGTALNAEQLHAARSILVASTKRVRELATEVGSNPSPKKVLEFQRAIQRHIGIQKAVSGAVAEAGRALSQQRMIADALSRDNKSAHERILDTLGGEALSEEAAKRLAAIPEDDVVGLNNFIKSEKNWSDEQKIESYYKANLLSSPRTVIRKTLGDVAMAVAETGTRFVAAGIEPAVAKLQGREREIYMRDAVAGAMGYVSAIPQATRQFAYVMRHGIDEPTMKALETPRYELPWGLKNPLNWSPRALKAVTSFAQFAAFRGELHSQAVRQAIKEGLKDGAIRARAAELVQHPTSKMIDAAEKQAQFQSYTEDPDKFLKAISRLRDSVQIPKGVPVFGGLRPLRIFVIPFLQIPYNITKMAVRYSPFGAMKLSDAEARKSSDASMWLARALIGSIFAGGLAYLYWKKQLTGPAPSGAAERDAFYRNGLQPWSIKVGNKWVSYSPAGHFALLAGMTIGLADRALKTGKFDADAGVQGLAAMGKALLNESFTKGIQNIWDAISEPGARTSNLVASTLGGFIPMESALRTLNDSLDPTIRNPQNIYERITDGLPIVSKSVQPRLDILGRPSQKEGSKGFAALFPGGIAPTEPRSSVDAELARLHDLGLKNVGFTGKKLTVDSYKLPLDEKEQQEYQGLRGKYLQFYLGNLFKSPDYEAMTDADKVDAAEEEIRYAEQDAREQMIDAALDRRMQRVEAGRVPRTPPRGMTIAPAY